jgi:hypothetical protein
VGFRYVVRGNRIAKVEDGPKPGNTPTRVPNTHPIKQKIRFSRANIFKKPFTRSTILLPSYYLKKARKWYFLYCQKSGFTFKSL